MTESQFEYSGLTVDELRTLATSPQVGAMEAMPRAFRSLAEQVGEVADLLSHAQSDLPNWWKGPAAEQAASALGRAAAEAREFHESALGAATAVGRCAQVVAEQQHQMMNVPDVAEPGVTDTIVRPATPMEALEAARKDAVYQAAHQQAVQVVHGIAAQYVETRGHLTAIGFALGEGFEPASGLREVTQTISTPHIQSPGENSKASSRQPQTAGPASEYADLSSGTANTVNPMNYRTISTKSERHSFDEPTSTTPLKSPSKNPHVNHSHVHHHEPNLIPGDFASPPSGKLQLGVPQNFDTPTREAGKVTTEYETPQKSGASQIDNKWEVDPQAVTKIQRPKGSETPRYSKREPAHSDNALRSKSFEDREAISIKPAPPNLEAALHPAIDRPDAANSTILPPAGSIGTMRREQSNRNPRPAYLKERKSEWLPDIIAAPPDGVLTPDWYERA
ncbi:MAG: hypothetical protein ACJ786_06430 [Catenulispora sp.]